MLISLCCRYLLSAIYGNFGGMKHFIVFPFLGCSLQIKFVVFFGIFFSSEFCDFLFSFFNSKFGV